MNQKVQTLLTLRLDELKKKFPQLTTQHNLENRQTLLAKILEELLKEQIPAARPEDAKTL